MLFNELRKQGTLAAKRHPMYEKNKFGKFFMYFMTLFWAGYFIFIGISLAFGFGKGFPGMEPYHIINKGLLIILFLDFAMRFPFQKTPTQEVKPYLLLPVKKNRILDFLLLRSGMSSFNFIWLFLFVPFAVIAVMPLFGITGVITYCLGIYLLTALNNYWYLLCRTLLNERIWWIFLPGVFYGIFAAAEFLLKHPISTFTMNLGEGFIKGNVLCFLGVLAAVTVLWLINRMVMTRLVYSEINKVEDTKVKRISEYKFLERYGEVGEYFRLELKLLFRNKRCKASLRPVGIVVIAFSFIPIFLEVYDGSFMKNFTAIYNFVALGSVFLSQIMSYEGNYLDGLMTRKETIYNLLKAKYYLYSSALLIPFMLMIPIMVKGKLSVLFAVSFALFTSGFIYFILFQLAVYNTKTVPLNEGLSARQNTGTAYQTLLSIGIFFFPIAIYSLLQTLFGEVIAQLIILIVGLGFTLTAHIWLKNIYHRFMKRRYKNMEGFRDTK